MVKISGRFVYSSSDMSSRGSEAHPPPALYIRLT